MNSQKTKFTVGLFVFGGIIIGLMAIVWLGMSRFLEKGNYYAAYFNESVQGLAIDSPVKYRGVAIGRVEKIGVASDSKLIQVVLKIESGQELDRSIVAQLKSVGITGSMFVELDRKKPGEPDRSPPLGFPSEFPVVASKPSDISVLIRGLDDVLNQIRALDLGGISGKIKATLDNVNGKVSDADLKGISENLKSSLSSAGRLLDHRKWAPIITSIETAARSLDVALEKTVHIMTAGEDTITQVQGIVKDEQDTVRTAFQDFRKAMQNANVLLEKGSALISGTDESLYYLKNSLLVTARNLERASENLNRLFELVAEHPPQLFFGQPPVPRKVETVGEETP